MRHFNWIISFLIVFIFSVGVTQAKQLPSDDLNLNVCIGKIKKKNLLVTKGYFNWGGSIIKGEDNRYHLFYSRWPNNFYGWLVESEVAHAVSDSPSGPWVYQETVLNGRGKGYWDAVTVHNPKIKYFEGKYYLYYISTNAPNVDYNMKMLRATNGKSTSTCALRNTLRVNQRTGVAVATSLSEPWVRQDKPLIEPSGPISTLTVNPAISRGADGKYYLIVKGDKPNDKNFVRNQAIAVSESPAGPFVMQKNPVIDNQDTEDMSLWYDVKRSLFYGIFHAHTYLGLVVSDNGLDWQKSKYEVVLKKDDIKSHGAPDIPRRMERPFVYVEGSTPKTLLTSVFVGDRSYIVTIPLRYNEE
ncbi:glycoside hydrolase family protein [Halosquirtibacter laminarini]|uniref:Glycoside hydrolase family protein n=1 Tax=Halosquirtibacter laminarini TaxID=3374600 RepID=A0AC61NBC2_9BACT|nr:glycoside hydrolase family protein [Prolixibacteraceae bacterium]